MQICLNEDSCKRLIDATHTVVKWSVEDVNFVLNKYASNLQKEIVVAYCDCIDLKSVAARHGCLYTYITSQFKKVLQFLCYAERGDWYRNEDVTAASPIYVLNLPTRIHNALMRGDITMVGDLCSLTRNELLRVRSLGELSVDIIVDALDNFGFKLAE